MVHKLEKIFVFFGTAVAESEDAGYPEGERHAVAGFGRGREVDYAAEIAAEHLLDAGWTDVEFEEGGEFDAVQLEEADDDIKTTYEKCLEKGSAGIVFDTVVEDEPEE